jgi:PPOX class probable F420-dependent enzyme
MSIPEPYRDLLEQRACAVLATLMPDGQPQATVVWCDYDGRHVLVNTMRGFRKERNMRADPRVALLAYALDNPLRYIEVRGEIVAMTEVGATAHLDMLSARYTGRSPYFGGCVPAGLAQTETPVLCRMAPAHTTVLDAGQPRRTAIDPPTVPASLREGPSPASHVDLLLGAYHGVLATRMPDGQPQLSIVWCDYDGTYVRINTTRERQKGRNMAHDPRVSLIVVDPADSSRYLEVRGRVLISEEGAIEHLDALTRTYTPHPCYYGHIYPVAQQARETRIIARLAPQKVTLDAIHR